MAFSTMLYGFSVRPRFQYYAAVARSLCYS